MPETIEPAGHPTIEGQLRVRMLIGTPNAGAQ